MRLKIYYLDDEAPLLEVFAETFDDARLDVRTFQNPMEFVTAVALKKPDLIFLDYRLPGVTGPELAKRLDPSIPKVLITGDLSVVYDKLFISVFEKPMKTEAIQAFLEECLKRKAG